MNRSGGHGGPPHQKSQPVGRPSLAARQRNYYEGNFMNTIVPYSHVLVLAGALFFLGAAAAVARRNLVMILIGVEVMLNAAGLALVAGSLRWQQLDGQALVLFIMCVAAAEVAVGLALIVYSQRRTGSLDADRYNLMKG